MFSLKLIAVGNSTGVILPKEVLSRLKLEKGDSLFITEAPEGYRLTPYDPNFEMQMQAAINVIGNRREGMKELSK